MTFPPAEQIQAVLARYYLVLGAVLLVLGAADYTVPEKMYSLWKKILSGRAVYAYGLALVLAGFPLTAYHGRLSTLLFIAGLVMVLTGPVIILYPDKVRSMFQEIENVPEGMSVKSLMRTEGTLVTAAGILCIAAYILS